MISKLQVSKIIGNAALVGSILIMASGCSPEQDILAPEGDTAESGAPGVPANQDRIENIEGDILFLDQPPQSVELNALVNDSSLFMFAEKTNHVLTEDITVDMSLPGDYFPDSVPDEQQTWESLNPGVVPAGTRVSAFYFHYDNETYDDTFNLKNYINCIGQYRVQAKVVFKQPVLGIVMRAGAGSQFHLRLSEDELGLASVDYCEHNLRHFPGINIADGCQSDRFILSEDRKTLYLTNNTDIHHDNYRVIVAAD